MSSASKMTGRSRRGSSLRPGFGPRGLLVRQIPPPAIALTAHPRTGPPGSQCFALALASCPVALWTGNLSAAADYTRLLIDLSTTHSLSHWTPYGLRYRKIIALRSGNLGTNSRSPDAGIEEIDQPDSILR